MTRRTRIKVCGITAVADALAAAGLGVDAIGLVFYPPSPRAVSIDRARAVVEALPAFVTRVGLFVDPQPAAVRAVLATVPLDVLQLHGDEPPSLCRSFGRPYIKAIRLRPGESLGERARGYEDAAAILVDAHHPRLYGGTGQTLDWDRKRLQCERPLVLAGGLTAENVAAAVAAVRPFAVDVSSGVERSPGCKDADSMQAFVEAVQRADQSNDA